jgi:hypothetical protein
MANKIKLSRRKYMQNAQKQTYDKSAKFDTRAKKQTKTKTQKQKKKEKFSYRNKACYLYAKYMLI